MQFLFLWVLAGLLPHLPLFRLGVAVRFVHPPCGSCAILPGVAGGSAIGPLTARLVALACWACALMVYFGCSATWMLPPEQGQTSRADAFILL